LDPLARTSQRASTEGTRKRELEDYFPPIPACLKRQRGRERKEERKRMGKRRGKLGSPRQRLKEENESMRERCATYERSPVEERERE